MMGSTAAAALAAAYAPKTVPCIVYNNKIINQRGYVVNGTPYLPSP
jgi:hypothetical protein